MGSSYLLKNKFKEVMPLFGLPVMSPNLPKIYQNLVVTLPIPRNI